MTFKQIEILFNAWSGKVDKTKKRKSSSKQDVLKFMMNVGKINP